MAPRRSHSVKILNDMKSKSTISPSVLSSEEEMLLNNFATRCFRNVADMDYINARLCYRAGLATQSSWAALQAIEKYYKAILLYNRIEARKVGHSLTKAQSRAQELPFKMRLSESTQSLVGYLDTFGQNRYLDISYRSNSSQLHDLDLAVWEIRRYCQLLNYSIQTPKGELHCLQPELHRIQAAEGAPPHKFHIVGGALEEVIKKKRHPSRSALIWKNLYFGETHRKVVTHKTWSRSENSPLLMYPKLLALVENYVMIPKGIGSAYRDYFSTLDCA